MTPFRGFLSYEQEKSLPTLQYFRDYEKTYNRLLCLVTSLQECADELARNTDVYPDHEDASFALAVAFSKLEDAVHRFCDVFAALKEESK